MAIRLQETPGVVKGKAPGRFWELDAGRGAALLLMLLYHGLYNLKHFGNYPGLPLDNLFWHLFQRGTASFFILLLGVSLGLSRDRARGGTAGGAGLFPKYLKRGLYIFAWGLVITLVTRPLLGEGYIVFGILHLAGLSVILAYPFLARPYLGLPAGILLIAAGPLASNTRVGFPWLLWLGLRPEAFYTADYFPLVPWFGLVLLGIAGGRALYPGHSRGFPLGDRSHLAPVRGLCFLGRNSLLFYLLHQPLLLGLFYLLGLVSPAW